MDAQNFRSVNNFLGMMSNADPHDIPSGALRYQLNMVVRKAGELRGRAGLEPAFGTRAVNDNIISLFRFDAPNGTHYVYQTSSGKIIARKNSGSVVTLGTGYDGGHCMCFAQTRTGIMFGLNGIDEPFQWDGYSSSLSEIGIDRPTVAPTITNLGGSSGLNGSYQFAYRYTDSAENFNEFDDGTLGPNPSAFSPIATASAALDTMRWQVTLPTQTRATRIELWRTTAGQSITFYKLKFNAITPSSQSYLPVSGTVTSCADNGSGFCRFTLPAGHGIVNAMRFLMSGNSEATYNVVHQPGTITATTVDTNIAFATVGSAATWILTQYDNDSASDATVEDYQSTQLTTLDGHEDIANRFVPPPNYFRCVAIQQDRAFYAGHATYSTGTVATNGTTTITGTGTNWKSTFIGRKIYIDNETQAYTITAASATSITVDEAVTNTASGLAYTIKPDHLSRNEILYSAQDEPFSVPRGNSLLIQENHETPDAIVGLAPNNNALMVAQRSHLYSIRYVSQPVIDATPNLIANRGLINNRCWTRYGESLFMVDRFGAYFATSGAVSEVDDAVSDYWQQETILLDSPDDEYVFVSADRNRNCCRFHFSLNNDVTYPQYWFEFNTRVNAWYLGFYAPALCGYAFDNLDPGTIYYGGINGIVLKTTAEGNSFDGSTHFTGTVTSATNSTITDSTASFTTACLDQPVTIVSGTGKDQTRFVTAQTSTEITLDTHWDENPDTTSVYSIGGIPWSIKTGQMFLGSRSSGEALTEALEVLFEPTNVATTFNIRRYYDNKSSAENFNQAFNAGNQITITSGSPDAVVNMKSALNPSVAQAGWIKHRYGGHRDLEMMTNRFISLELSGVQGSNPVIIYELGFYTTGKEA
jgi:hypothetical protein